MNTVNWNIAQIWNEFAMKENRPLVPRDYIYASEVGGSFYDRYNKMKAVQFTNPPNDRSLRKFLAGNVWENVVRQVLIGSGILKHEEKKIDATPYENLLAVHGRCDFIGGGYINYDEQLLKLQELNLPDYLEKIGLQILNSYAGKNLAEKIIELKSVSTFAFDKVDRQGEPMASHQMQGYHYQKNANIPASVLYVCKDDCRMRQYNINAEKCEPIYHADIEKMTYYYENDVTPPLERLVIFDELLLKFAKNIIAVEYSPYLSHYGFDTPEEYRNAVSYTESWNRVLDRYVLAETGAKTKTGKPITITPKNKEVVEHIESKGYNFFEILERKINSGDVIEIEE